MAETDEAGGAAEAAHRVHTMHEKRVQTTCPAAVERSTAMAADATQSPAAGSVKSVNSLSMSASSPAGSGSRREEGDPVIPELQPGVERASTAPAGTPPARAVTDLRVTSPGSEGSLDCSSTRIAGGVNPFTTPSQPAAAFAAGVRRARHSHSPSKHRCGVQTLL